MNELSPIKMKALLSFIKSLTLFALTALAPQAVLASVQNSKHASYVPSTDSHHLHVHRDPLIRYLSKLKKAASNGEDIGALHNPSSFRLGILEKRNIISPLFRPARARSFPRESRARIDRMPLAFGKRSGGKHWEREYDHLFSRLIRSRMDRMPLTFGKRLPAGSDSVRGSDAQKFPKATTIHPSGLDLTANENGGVAGGPFVRHQRNRLTRMPITFGKRNKGDISNDELGNAVRSGDISKEAYSRETRGSLSRMPLTFGKRLKALNMEDVAKIINHHHVLDAKGKLLLRLIDQLPSEGSLESGVKSLYKSRHDKANKGLPLKDNTNVMDPISKRAGEITQSDSYPNQFNDDNIDDSFELQRRSVMDRMPLTFGKKSSGFGKDFKGLLDRYDGGVLTLDGRGDGEGVGDADADDDSVLESGQMSENWRLQEKPVDYGVSGSPSMERPDGLKVEDWTYRHQEPEIGVDLHGNGNDNTDKNSLRSTEEESEWMDVI